MPIPPIDPYPMPVLLPDNVAPWRIDPGRAMLLVHDMQRYFVETFPAGRSPVTELVANIGQLRAACEQAGVPVGYTAQPGDMTEEQRGLLRDFWGPGMTAGPEQRAIIPELTPDEHDQLYTKWRYSAFHRSALLDFLRAQGRDQLVLCGVYAHVGVLMTACDAFTHDIETFVVADAVADFDEARHRQALEYAAQRCAVAVTTHTAVGALTMPRVTS